MKVQQPAMVGSQRRFIETLQTTAVVFGFIVLAGFFFWVLDLLLAWATRLLTGQGG